MQNISNASPCVDLVRMKKDLQEQVLMIESSKINDAVMEEIIPFIQEGVTEKQLAKKLDELFFNYTAFIILLLYT